MRDNSTFTYSKRTFVSGFLGLVVFLLSFQFFGNESRYNDIGFLSGIVTSVGISIVGIFFFIKGRKEHNTFGKWFGLLLCLGVFLMSSLIMFFYKIGIH